VHYTYEVPSFFKSHKAAHSILDGWQISGSSTFQTGSPFTPGYSISGVNNQNITGSYTEGARLALVGDPSTGSSDPYNRIKLNALAAPRVGSIGLEAPRNYMINPGISNFNLSLQKSFSVRERVKMQLRADAFNVFNHTQFSGINSTLNFGVLSPTPSNPFNFISANTAQGGVLGANVNGVFTPVSPSNTYLYPNGTLNNKNGFGTVSGARDPRIMQLVVRLQF
jgi:hypothetical protein